MSKESDKQPSLMSLEMIARQAREIAMRDGGHSPTVIIEGDLSAAVCQIAKLGDSNYMRMIQMRVAGQELAKRIDLGDPKQVFFISEGWMSTTIKGKLPHVRPSDDPNRIEILLINHLHLKTNQTQTVGYEMTRSNNGKLVDLRKLSDMEPQGAHSKNYLLDAFVTEFRRGRQMRNN